MEGLKGWLKWRESSRRGDTVRDRVIFGLFREPGIFLSAWLRRPVGCGYLMQVERAPAARVTHQTSNRKRLPAEFKHITKRRRRN